VLLGLALIVCAGPWLLTWLMPAPQPPPVADPDDIARTGIAPPPTVPGPRRPASPPRTTQSWPPSGPARSTASGAHRPARRAAPHPPGRHAVDTATARVSARTERNTR